jgi:hypothetical protein
LILEFGPQRRLRANEKARNGFGLDPGVSSEVANVALSGYTPSRLNLVHFKGIFNRSRGISLTSLPLKPLSSTALNLNLLTRRTLKKGPSASRVSVLFELQSELSQFLSSRGGVGTPYAFPFLGPSHRSSRGACRHVCLLTGKRMLSALRLRRFNPSVRIEVIDQIGCEVRR